MQVMSSQSRATPALVFALFATLGLLCTNFPTWGWPGGDGRDYANLTEALVVSGNFDLRNSRFPERRPDDPTIVRKSTGEIYSIFPVGRAIYNAPFFAAGSALAEGRPPVESMIFENLSFSVATALLYAVTCCLVFLLLRDYFGYREPWALGGALIYGLATLAFPFSKSNGVEPLQVALFAGIVYFGMVPRRWSLPLVAVLFGCAVIAKPPSAIVLPVLIYLFFRFRLWSVASPAARVVAILGALGTAALFFYYNWLRSGDAAAAYAVGHAADIKYALENIVPTVWPLLFGPDRNLFLNNPVLLFALPGFFLLRDRPFAIVTAMMWLGLLLFYGASGNQNWGAYVGNGRYAMPYIFLLVPYALASIQYLMRLQLPLMRAASIVAVFGVLAWSCYVQVLYASFSEFHVKQFERQHNAVARQAGIEQLEEARHQLQFAHTLFWHTESCVHPGRGQSFPYPSADPGKSRFSGSVLSGFPQQFFCKDYLFLNTDFVSPVAWLGTLRWVLLAMLLLLACTLLWLVGSQSRLETANDAHSG